MGNGLRHDMWLKRSILREPGPISGNAIEAQVLRTPIGETKMMAISTAEAGRDIVPTMELLGWSLPDRTLPTWTPGWSTVRSASTMQPMPRWTSTTGPRPSLIMIILAFTLQSTGAISTDTQGDEHIEDY